MVWSAFSGRLSPEQAQQQKRRERHRAIEIIRDKKDFKENDVEKGKNFKRGILLSVTSSRNTGLLLVCLSENAAL